MSPEVPIILLVLATPVFLFWYWFYRKRIVNAGKRRAFVWVSTIISTPIVYLGIVLIWLFCISYYPNRDFDRKKWNSEKDTRYEMSKDIINRQMLIGKTKNEVKAILGDEGNNMGEDMWWYPLGNVPDLLNIDPDVLEITFKNGRVVSVRQHNT